MSLGQSNLSSNELAVASPGRTTVSNLQPVKNRIRFLVVIASFGNKNLDYLKRIIHAYQGMDGHFEIMVVSNVPKDLGPKIKVIVGLPAPNPWSLPFAHKAVFASNLDHYDFFVYTEDDIWVTERNIKAFLEITPRLANDEIAGFMRFEVAPDGTQTFPEVHGAFHWKPESVRQNDGMTFAEFTNVHAGFYMLTQRQLRQVISSGNFCVAPYEEQYGLPETAATDPYTRCGFRKVICISRLDDFLIHHMPNRYVGQLGIPLSSMREQIGTLEQIGSGLHPASTLCPVESKLQHGKWSKCYDELPLTKVLELVPDEAKTVLSVGVGFGAGETKLVQQGKSVTALPLDSVAASHIAQLGMEVINGSLKECFNQLGCRRFDCVMVTNLLHLQNDPETFIQQCSDFVKTSGVLVLSGPNLQSISIWVKRLLNKHGLRKLRSFKEGGVQADVRRKTLRKLDALGFGIVAASWFNLENSNTMQAKICRAAGRFAAECWVIQARPLREE